LKRLPPIPYKPNCPASAEVFVGRAELLRMATSGLQMAGICYSIIGKPGMGKTSLLNAISRSLLSQSQKTISGTIPLPIYVDCHQRKHQNLTDLLQDLLVRMIEALQIQQKLDCPAPLLEKAQTIASQDQNLITILNPLLDCGFEQKQCNYLPVLMFDDLHRLCQTNWLVELASLLQTAVNHQQIALILAGRDALTDELRNDVSPLRLLITQNCELEPLTPLETDSLVTKAKDAGWFVEADFSTQIHQFTEGHPYRLHYYLYRALASQNQLTIDGLHVLDTPENKTYLEDILHSQGSDPRQNEVQLTQEKAQEIRAYVRENQLDMALDCLLNFQQHQHNADLLTLQLNFTIEQERRGTLPPSQIHAERVRIADQILKLVSPIKSSRG